MSVVLLSAGIYNLLWGAFAIFFPNALFDWLAMARPNYPQFWQCIGMIVGVYGLGYGIASFDPVRHWPIVFVGFLGKIFGPLGMAQALWTGELPWAFAINCLTNDLIWWVPFALILKHALDQHLAEPWTGESPDEASLLKGARTNQGETLAELSRSRTLLVVFLRHSGCTFCREAMTDLSEKRAEIEGKGSSLVLVHMGDEAAFHEFARSYGLEKVPAIADPERRFYLGLGLRRGQWWQLLGPQVWRRGAQAFFSGHGIGQLEGDGLQMPGVLVIRDGRIIHRFLHRTAADRPDYLALVSGLAS